MVCLRPYVGAMHQERRHGADPTPVFVHWCRPEHGLACRCRRGARRQRIRDHRQRWHGPMGNPCARPLRRGRYPLRGRLSELRHPWEKAHKSWRRCICILLRGTGFQRARRGSPQASGTLTCDAMTFRPPVTRGAVFASQGVPVRQVPAQVDLKDAIGVELVWASKSFARAVIVKPSFSWLETGNDRVPGSRCVL